ncbi:MAG: imidazolonepropionase [Deltaproteobacteria bacterium HGW-Deltaproteobacteria-22]|jgi:imidazolonepropionase|nr:MAG: imidazolonepropionase [Deltaproteobacteria bacterium HGW-Deltaproteobacteria-22]
MILECQLNSDRDRLRLRLSEQGWVERTAWRLYGTGCFCAPTIERVQLSSCGTRVAIRFDDGREGLLEATDLAPQGPPTLVIRNIGQLVRFDGAGRFEAVPDAVVLIRHDRILAAGPRAEVPVPDGQAHVRAIDARGGVVSAGLVDPHTHPVFAGDRAREFAMRKAGATYAEIQAAGGGILSTMRATREATDEELFRTALRRLARMSGFGVTSIEGKSGYDLTADGEIRMLRVLRRLGARSAVDVSPTLLAAHIVPPEFASDRAAYVRLIVEDMIPRSRDLAVSVDVFCEENAFSVAETVAILEGARDAGLRTRVHAGQFNSLGVVSEAARLASLSVDHLEQVSDGEFDALARTGGTTAVLLPGAALTLGLPVPSGRAFLDRGIPVAVGTDCNPGTSMTENLPLAGTLACLQMGLTVEETWDAMTRTAARAAGFTDRGNPVAGAAADLVVWNFGHYGVLPYHFGVTHVRSLIRQGVEVQLESE